MSSEVLIMSSRGLIYFILNHTFLYFPESNDYGFLTETCFETVVNKLSEQGLNNMCKILDV